MLANRLIFKTLLMVLDCLRGFMPIPVLVVVKEEISIFELTVCRSMMPLLAVPQGDLLMTGEI